MAGMHGFAYAAPYIAAKHGAVGLTRALAAEYAKTSLRVNALGIVLVKDGIKQELLADRAAVDSDEVVLQARVQHGTLQFGWRLPNEEVLHDIGPVIDATYMSDETTRGFTGTMIGMACVDSYRRNVLAHFDYFDLQNGSHLD